MTLVELLVVVMIMVILLGIAVPLMKPQLADRRIREASRQLNAFIANAQARAAATGRSVGISFSRTDNANSNISYQVYFAETPAPYVGDTTAARAVFTIVDDYDTSVMPAVWLEWYGVAKLQQSWSAAPNGGTAADLVREYDLIQFNRGGPYYYISNILQYNTVLQTVDFEFRPLPRDIHSVSFTGAPRHLVSNWGADMEWGQPGMDDNGQFGNNDAHEIGWPSADDQLKPLTFQIIRKPQRVTAGSLSMPNGTAVILGLSGFDGVLSLDPMTNNVVEDHHEFSALAQPDTTPVTIMFRPDGSVEQVFYGVSGGALGLGVIADEPIYLLVGSSLLNERLDPALSTPTSPPLPAAAPRNQDPLLWQNLNDLNNLWVTIGHRTGSVTTSPMQDWQTLYVAPPADPEGDTLVKKTRSARALTVSGQSVGGK